jgi:archaellum component FlaC
MYSEYENNEGWFETNGVKWEKSLFELIKLHMELAEQGTSDDVTDDILDKINDMIEEAGGERQDDIDSALETLIDLKTKNFGKEVSDMITDEEDGLKAKFIAACVALAKLNFDLGQAKAANENGDEYFLVRKNGNLITKDTDESGANYYTPEGQLATGYELIYPMGFPNLENGYNQGTPTQETNPDVLESVGAQNTLTLFEGEDQATYDGGNDIAAYEKWLKDLIAKYQGRVVDLETDDNFYNVYMSRAKGEAADNFNTWIEPYVSGDGAIFEDIDPEVEEAGKAWQDVKDAYDELSDEALAYMALSVEERRAAWRELDEDVQEELRTFCALLRAADTDQPNGYGWTYDAEVIAEQDAAIEAYEDAVAAYNEAVAAAYRAYGQETLAFLVYTAAVAKDELYNIAIDRDRTLAQILSHPERFFDNAVEALTNAGRDVDYPNYMTAYNNRKANYAIDMLNGYLAHLQNSKVYKEFDALRKTVGTPSIAAVEDDPETEDVDETTEAVEATGEFLALETAVLALNETGTALYNALYGIEDTEAGEEAPARLNIIWNDGSDSQIVGIMDAVVKRTATEAGDNAIYNLNGMRVKNAGKGIFIQNGKKVIK